MNAVLCRCVSLLVLTLGWTAAQTSSPTLEAVQLKAADGVSVFGDHYPHPSPRAVLLLFHQANSNRGEYAPLAPLWQKQGYAALAIDQRSGGSGWDRKNETRERWGKVAGYAEALPDLEAALKWAKGRYPRSKVVLFGSSYSAALVLVLASRHPDLGGVVAFSPSESLGSPDVVKTAARTLKMPVFLSSSGSGEEVAAARALYDVIPAKRRVLYTPKAGIHGASSLRPDRNFLGGAPANMAALEAFLKKL